MLQRQSTRAGNDDLSQIMRDPESKDFADLRDRAAYVHCTGTFPTHLRAYMMSLLRLATDYHVGGKVSLDGRSGSMALDAKARAALGLDSHPMVAQVSKFVNDGYRIFHQRDINERRPFSKILMYKPVDGGDPTRIMVQKDGSIREGWAA